MKLKRRINAFSTLKSKELSSLFGNNQKFSVITNIFNSIEESIVDIKELKEHEEVDPKKLEKIVEEIKSEGIIRKAIAVDKNTKIILDGAHRFNALKMLGCKKIPVIFVDYNLPEIQVKSWRRNEKIDKKMVIKAGLSGKKLPPKTSKHIIKIGNKTRHISFIEKEVNIPLEKLK